ncbi:conserved hypothetical protein [Heliomicrobium modesticaldum Ice1]|uniref:Membrane-anchored protein n=1 Tax=Heliobacterium modesticaldum (strain ATCC 51547 / Ice1) TaxID=498761 RepID=B0TBS5_HELMI|nr:GDYXXLXY domain-containing protein [Heliomicrobium modesticaldum]ABZ83914.1 conserved hypothetical protein [Heliomicrobium modesticaldum Ice1]
MMRRNAFIAVVILQVLVLLFMAGSRAVIVSAGQEITLKAAPVDPRHPFMGDYVRLRYNISEIDTRAVPNDITEGKLKNGSKVYVIVEEQQGLYQPVGLYCNEPVPGPGQVVLKGRFAGLRYPVPPAETLSTPEEKEFYRDAEPSFAWVEYGLEEYYVPEGTGLQLEQALREQKDVFARVKVWRGDCVLTAVST